MPKTSIKYELILIFDRFKGYTVKQIYDKLKVKIPLKTLYNYKTRYKKADRIARSLI